MTCSVLNAQVWPDSVMPTTNLCGFYGVRDWGPIPLVWTLSVELFLPCFTRAFGSGPSGSKGWSTRSKCSLNIKLGNKLHRVGTMFMGVASNLDLDIIWKIKKMLYICTPLLLSRTSKADETIYSLKLLDLLDMLWKTCWVCRVLEFLSLRKPSLQNLWTTVFPQTAVWKTAFGHLGCNYPKTVFLMAFHPPPPKITRT